MISNLLLVVHLVVAVAIVTLVLLQQGKGADAGAAFGGGSSQSLFGAVGASNFLSRTTSILVALFFSTSLSLAYLYSKQKAPESVIEGSVMQQVEQGTQSETTESDVPQTETTEPAPATQESDVPTAPE
ncbi:MAG: preprotein translocase subunit SecG [Arenicellales bacterium]